MALADYCRENGIEPASRQYDDARELMIILYQNGVGGGGFARLSIGNGRLPKAAPAICSTRG